MSKIYRDGEIYLYGDVGDLWFDESFTASDVVEALSIHGSGNPVVVHINSGGGIATEGAAIYSILTGHKGGVSIEIDGIAASASSLIAMAGGDNITMRTGSVMMVHDPAGYFMGYTEDDLEEAKRQLSSLATTYSQVYAEKTGQTAEQCRVDMKSTLWLTPDEAVEKGYATKAGNDNAIMAAAFDYRIYAKAPEQLVALATDKNWKLNGSKQQAVLSAANPPIDKEKEIDMTEKERADKLAAELAKMTATNEANAAKVTAFEKKEANAERVAAVMALPEAEKRQDLATALAAQGLTAESAKVALAASPEVEHEQTTGNTASGNYVQNRVIAAGQAAPGNGGKPVKTQAKINPTDIYAKRQAAA